METNLNILKENKEAKFVTQRSKFFSYSFFVENVSAQNIILKNIKKLHPSATHICFASIIDESEPTKRTSDDGEPSGSAGQPILSVLLEGGFVNTLVVVVRYFGGVKLGVAGLFRAYKNSATLVLSNNSVPASKKFLYNLVCPLNCFDYLKKACFKLKTPIFSENFGENVSFSAYLSDENLQTLKPFLTSFSKQLNFKYIEKVL